MEPAKSMRQNVSRGRRTMLCCFGTPQWQVSTSSLMRIRYWPMSLSAARPDGQRTAASSDVEMFTAADVGFISQNVDLYCASAGLATVVRGSVDRTELAKTLKLRPTQKIILAQSVDFPKKWR